MSQRAGWCCTQGVKCTLTAKLLIFALGCCLIRNNGEGMQCINWSIMARHQWMWSPQQKSIMIHHSHTMTALPVITELQATKANQLTKQQSTPQSLCCIPLIDFALWKKSFLSWKGLLSGGECTFIASIVVRGSIFQWASFLCVVKVCTSAILAHVSTKMAHKQKWHWRELPLRKTDFVSPKKTNNRSFATSLCRPELWVTFLVMVRRSWPETSTWRNKCKQANDQQKLHNTKVPCPKVKTTQQSCGSLHTLLCEWWERMWILNVVFLNFVFTQTTDVNQMRCLAFQQERFCKTWKSTHQEVGRVGLRLQHGNHS